MQKGKRNQEINLIIITFTMTIEKTKTKTKDNSLRHQENHLDYHNYHNYHYYDKVHKLARSNRPRVAPTMIQWRMVSKPEN